MRIIEIITLVGFTALANGFAYGSEATDDPLILRFDPLQIETSRIYDGIIYGGIFPDSLSGIFFEPVSVNGYYLTTYKHGKKHGLEIFYRYDFEDGPYSGVNYRDMECLYDNDDLKVVKLWWGEGRELRYLITDLHPNTEYTEVREFEHIYEGVPDYLGYMRHYDSTGCLTAEGPVLFAFTEFTPAMWEVGKWKIYDRNGNETIEDNNYEE